MIDINISGLLLTATGAAIVSSIRNILEKYLFFTININDYLLIRSLLIAIFMTYIYFVFPKILPEFKTSNLNKLKNNYQAISLIVIITILSIMFPLFTNYGISKYYISLFSVLFAVIYLLLNTVAGIFLFNEKLTLINIIGILFGLTSIILMNV